MLYLIYPQQKHLLVFLLGFFTYSALWAQISGTVSDSATQKPLVYATIALFKAADSARLPIQGTFTDEKGHFVFEQLENGTYRVEIAMTEYNVKKIDKLLISETQKSKDLGIIGLKPAEAQLAAVIIEAQRPIIESKEDRLIYNVENDMLAQSGTTIEVMKRVPFVSVDQDDKIRVKGQTSFKVLVNGKATGIISRNPSEALKAFPANAIKKIEVITNPSAKYDAEGASAVINIITKKQLSGYNGGINGSINTFKQGWGNLYFNMKQGNFGASGYAGLSNWGGVPSTFNSYRKSLVEGNLYTQYTTGNNLYRGLGGYGNIELAYDIDTLKSLSLYGNPNFWMNSGENESHFEQIGTQNEIQRSSTFFNETAGLNKGTDIGLDYVQKFGSAYSEHELSFSFLHNQDNNDDSTYNKNSDSYGLAREFKNRNFQKNRETTLAADYAKPLKHSQKIGFGIKAILRQNEANYGNYLLDTTSNTYQVNPALSNEFTYQQGIYAGYGEYSVEVKKWTIKPSVRVEHTQVKGDFRTVDTLIRFQYTNLIPALSIIYKSNPTQNLKFSYNKRLQRPGLWYLNPFVDNSNPLAVSTGNPYLLPEVTHTVDVGFSKFGSFGNLNVSVYQNIQTQGISSFTTFNAEKGGSFTSYYNMGRTYGTGLSVNMSGKVGKNLSFFVNSSAEYQTYLNTFNGIKYKNSGIMGNGYASATYQLPKDFRIQANGNFWSGDVNIQGRNGMWYSYGLGAGKSFFKKKLTFTISGQNFFARYLRSVALANDPTFESRNEYLQPMRSVRFSLNYNFGDLKEQVSRKKGVSNDDSKGGGKGKGG